ncbi:MAG: low specificity L-threonine aldolase [Planctomycetales bacterium]|nr:low specificity L-threonine aldolase [Planctomycetales bacterium]
MPIPIDLRSDTVTQPCAAMRAAIAAAEVGDDVIGSDPTVERLQEVVADMLGKEAALFMPSGSMTNQVAIRLHCGRGDEFLCEADCHVYNYEQAAFAQLSGICARTVQGQYGILRPEQLHGMIRAAGDHLVRTALVCLENTHNRGGGTIQPLETVDAICQWAKQNSLATHLDGARLFNAVVETGVDLKRWCRGFDSVSVCFSKGLGAPVGSAVAGSRDFIRDARRARKLFGGGMRQAGIIAAGALYALEHNIGRLGEDHQHARLLAEAIECSPGLYLDPAPQTNIVVVRLEPHLGTSREFTASLLQHGVGALPFGPQHFRLVTHLDVKRPQVQRAGEIIEQLAKDMECS